MDIDAVIAEAIEVAPVAEATEVAKEAEAPKEEAKEEDLSSKPDSELTPEQLAKREANRESHRNSREAKLRRQTRELQARIAEYEAKLAPPPAPVQSNELVEPKESDYNSWLEYTNALRKYDQAVLKKEFEQKLEQLTPKEQKQVAPEYTPEQAERIQQIGQKAVQFMEAVPEYKVLYQQHAEFFDGIPKALEDALFEADDAPLALYALMKEDRLYDLEGMTPSRIAMELGKAEERGKSYLNPPKPVTSAPQPFPKAGRVTSGGKSLDNMSPDEILNLVRNN
jgi:hypothetical protein